MSVEAHGWLMGAGLLALTVAVVVTGSWVPVVVLVAWLAWLALTMI